MSKTQINLILLLLLAVGGVVRFYNLGHAAYRADTIDFLRLGLPVKTARSGSIAVRLDPPKKDWVEHMPLAKIMVEAFRNVLNLKVDLERAHTTVRIPFALMGTLTLLGVFLLVRQIFDPKLALLAVFLALLNPYHIHVSREAYHYVGITLFSTLTLWMFCRVWQVLQAERRFAAGAFAGWAIFGLLMCHTHLTTWVALGVQWLILAVTAFRKPGMTRKEAVRFGTGLFMMAVAILVVVVPVISGLFNELLPRLAEKHPHRPGQWLKVFQVLFGFMPAFTFGDRWFGYLLFVLVMGGLLWWSFSSQDNMNKMKCFGWMFLLHLAPVFFMMAAVGKGTAKYSYFAVLWPFVMIIMMIGIAGLVGFISRKPFGKSIVIWLIMMGLLIGYFTPPLKAQWALTGKPKPYKELVAWCDQNLPLGTPALVDRWYEPWNELALYKSTQAIFTFTVPDEPLENFKRGRWRTTAMNFCRKYPDAAYIELAKNHFTEPDVGFWDWPRNFFKQHHRIRNAAGIELQKMGLNFRPGGKVYQEGLVIDIFYNTREDVIRKKALKREYVFPYFGKGWGYDKPWREDQSFKDWRVLHESAELELISVVNEPMMVNLSIRAKTRKGTKHVQWAKNPEVGHIFNSEKLETWVVGDVPLASGINVLRFVDHAWGLGQTPLYVDEVMVKPREKPGL